MRQCKAGSCIKALDAMLGIRLAAVMSKETNSCWDLVEYNHSGTPSVIDQLVSSTRNAGEALMPFIKPEHFKEVPAGAF